MLRSCFLTAGSLVYNSLTVHQRIEIVWWQLGYILLIAARSCFGSFFGKSTHFQGPLCLLKSLTTQSTCGTGEWGNGVRAEGCMGRLICAQLSDFSSLWRFPPVMRAFHPFGQILPSQKKLPQLFYNNQKLTRSTLICCPMVLYHDRRQTWLPSLPHHLALRRPGEIH